MSEIAWAAGLFEGEGSIVTQKWRRTARPDLCHEHTLSLGSSDQDVLQRFADVVGGRVHGPYRGQGSKTPEHYRPMYQWRISNICEVQHVLRLFWPYLGERRRAKAADLIASYYESGRKVPQRRNRLALVSKER